MTSKATPRQYVVVGGGIAGLSAAIHLAAAGHSVRLFEKNPRLGGKLNTWTADGFTFDSGPHVLTMLFAFERLFGAAGETLEECVELVRMSNVCRYHFPDGVVLDSPSDPAAAARVLDGAFPGSKAGFERFLTYSGNIYDKTVDTFLTQDVATAMRVGGPIFALRNMRDFLKLKPFETLDDCVSRYFRDERLRQIFRLYALYSGSHPKRCSAIFSTVAHVQWHLGTYYVMGGLYKLIEATENLLSKLDIQVTNAEVTQIKVRHGRVCGVKASIGGTEQQFYADGVICNRDVLSANGLFGTPKPVPKVEPSTSAFLMLLGIEGNYDTLAHHNSFLTGDEWGEYESLFDRRLPFADPTIGVSCQSVTDQSRAPAGMSNLFVMANVPAIGSEFRWSAAAVRNYRQIILDKLERMGLPRLSKRIVVEQIWTPDDLEQTYNAHRGAIYGLSSNGWRQAFLRPAQRATGVRGLFYAGGSTHPGGGLPLCVLSGEIAAGLSLEEA